MTIPDDYPGDPEDNPFLYFAWLDRHVFHPEIYEDLHTE